MTTNVECIIIGDAKFALGVRDTLVSYGVPVKAIAHNSGDSNIVRACASEPKLQVVALSCRSIPKDFGAGLISALRGRLGEKVKIHALVESRDREGMAAQALAGSHPDKVDYAYPFSIESAGMVIRQRWFNGAQRLAANPSEGEPPKEQGLPSPTAALQKKDPTRMEQFAEAFLKAAAECKKKPGWVSDKTLSDLRKLFKITEKPPLLAAGGWIVPMPVDEGSRIGWYQAGEKMAEIEVAPTNSFERAKWCVSRKAKLLARKSALEEELTAKLAEVNASLEEVKRAEEILRQLDAFGGSRG